MDEKNINKFKKLFSKDFYTEQKNEYLSALYERTCEFYDMILQQLANLAGSDLKFLNANPELGEVVVRTELQTIAQKEKLNDFRNAYMQIFNSNNNEYMSLVINTIFDNVEKNYEEFSDEIEKVSINQENDELNILKPENGYYSLLDFLLNRVFKNIQMIDTLATGNGY